MNTVVGHCPHCGAPVYAPTIWHGVTPPPSTPSCGCTRPTTRTVVTDSTNDRGWRVYSKKREI